VDSFYYTDSKNALFWISTPLKKLQVYVQRRVAEILANTEATTWGYVASTKNPADIPTRDKTVEELIKDTCWVAGPSLLSSPEYIFVPFSAIEPTEEALKEMKAERALFFEEGDRVAIGGSVECWWLV